MLGATIGTYRVIGTLGTGGMGAVYAAEHTVLGNLVAIKVLLPTLSHQAEYVTRFFNEARAVAAVAHPGIVEMRDSGWSPDGSAFIVMEHLHGESLADRLDRGPLHWSAALDVARQIAAALAAAHAQRIVHRDLKPANLFIVSDPAMPSGERIKLLDFGIAKLALDSVNQSLTPAGTVLGTPTYMAPEQCQGAVLDHRVDLYALGCVIFKMCAGHPPFDSRETAALLVAHLQTVPPKLGSLVPGIPLAVEELVAQLLAKRPEDRPRDAQEVIDRIDLATRTIPAGATTGPTTAPLATQNRSGHRDHTLSGNAEIASPGSLPGDPQVTARVHRRSRWRAIARSPLTIIAASVIVLAVSQHAVQRLRASGGAVAERATGAVASPPPVSAAPPAPTASAPVSPASPPAASAPAVEVSAVDSKTPSVARPSSTRVAKPPSVAVLAPVVAAVVIESVPTGALVVRDGVPQGRTPYRAPAARGDAKVTYVVQLKGYDDQQIVVRANRPFRQRVELVKTARPDTRDGLDISSENPF